MTNDITLADVRESYILARNVSDGYALQLRYSITSFERYLGRPATVSDLNPETVNRWLKATEDGATIALRTIKGYRGSALTLWKFAYEERQAEVPPRRVRNIKVPRKSPVAWTAEQIRRLIEVASQLPGRYQRSRVLRGAFWRALILVTWDTGLRRGDLRALTTADARGRDTFTVTQHKTGIPIVCKLRQETIEAVDATYPPNRPLLFGCVLSTVKTSMTLKSLAEKAGLPTHGGAMRMLRRSAATALEIVMPGAAMRFLGHATPGLAHRHYIDPVILGASGACPPSLLSAGLDGVMLAATEVPSLGAIQELLERAIVSAKVKETVITIPPGDILPVGLALPAPSPDIMPLVEKFLLVNPWRVNDRRCLIRMALEECGVWTVADLAKFDLNSYIISKRDRDGLTKETLRSTRSCTLTFLRWLAIREQDTVAAACFGRATYGLPAFLRKGKGAA